MMLKRSLMSSSTLIILLFLALTPTKALNTLEVTPMEVIVTKGDNTTIQFQYSGELLVKDLYIELETSSSLELNPSTIVLSSNTTSKAVEVLGVSVTSLTYIDVKGCWFEGEPENSTDSCPFNKSSTFVVVKVVHSNIISVLVFVTGWIYFFAWSISFYPQIFLNWKRKSVIGLNFDFLVLNIIGFSCYTVYNVMLYFDANVQSIYIETHARSLIPVLLNDVVFAAHALVACIVTGLQCFLYERGTQRISYICRGWSSILVTFAVISLVVTLMNVLNWLQFINYLSYVKIAVTLSKYFPQAILNYKRKSTVGWSIGNVLLDFSGGFMDICQMILQASNTEDWSAFYGNPVKFGLGMISMVFDVFFIIQHYGLYRHSSLPAIFQEDTSYDQVETNEREASVTTRDTSPNTSNLEIRA